MGKPSRRRTRRPWSSSSARCDRCSSAAARSATAPTKQKGDLRLDSRAAILAGGSTGPAVVPGKAGESLLVDAINYGDLYQMPPKSKLPASEIAVLTRWVDMGAPWPGDDRPKSAAKADAGTFDLEARAKHWSFQPIRAPEPPEVRDRDWPKDPIDRFILAELEAKGLAPAPEADRRTLIRRATFDLIGLPPSPRRSTPSSRTRPPTPSRRWSTACSRRPTTASAGGGTGSTWSATPRRPGTSSTTTSRAPRATATT